MTLGVFYRLWSLLEQSCCQLDLELAMRTTPSLDDCQSFIKYATMVRDLADFKTKKYVQRDVHYQS